MLELSSRGYGMDFYNEGMSLRFDADAALAEGGLKVTVVPRHPGNVVAVHYRVDGGRSETLPATAVSSPWTAESQQFCAVFPPLPPGALVEYRPVCENAGRRVPALGPTDFPACFRVPRAPAPAEPPAGPNRKRVAGPEPLVTEYLMSVSAFVSKPEVFVETPEGLRVTWELVSGTFEGPRLRGVVREAVDLMTIRRDGIGVMDVQAILETHDGAFIYDTYSGIFDLGEDGYENFRAGRYPKAPLARAAPKYVTVDARYTWMNRIQCVLAGQVFMDTLNFVYDAYIVR